MLYYSYRMPPMYDSKLSEIVLNMLLYVPIFYFAFGYWMLSSKQLLSNEYLIPIQNIQDTPSTQHTINTVFTRDGWAGPSWPFLLLTLTVSVGLYFRDYLNNYLKSKLVQIFKWEQIEHFEYMDNYWATLDDEDRSWSIEEEKNVRNLFIDMKILTNYQYSTLINTPKTVGKTLIGTHSFDILCNPYYINEFQYIPMNIEDRKQYIIDDDSDEENDAFQSNLTRLMLNLGYLKKK